MIRVAVANQKGGVGQDHDRHQLGDGAGGNRLARCCSSTSIRRAMPRPGWVSASAARERSSYDVLLGESSIAEAAVATKVPRLDLLPATVDLSGAEIEMVAMDDRTHRLAQAFDEVPAGRWDICLLDCPPSLGLLTVNALVASRQLLVPLQCEFFALEGLSQLLQTVERIRLAFNPAAFHPRRRADHVRSPQQSVAAGGRRCPRLPWQRRCSKRWCHAMCGLSEAPSHGLAGADLRSQMPGLGSLYQAWREKLWRGCRARGGGGMKKATGPGARSERADRRGGAPSQVRGGLARRRGADDRNRAESGRIRRNPGSISTSRRSTNWPRRSPSAACLQPILVRRGRRWL